MSQSDGKDEGVDCKAEGKVKPVIVPTSSEVLNRARNLVPNILKTATEKVEVGGDPLVTICDSDDDDTSSESDFSSDEDDDDAGAKAEKSAMCKVQMDIAFIPWEQEEHGQDGQEKDSALIKEIDKHENIEEKS